MKVSITKEIIDCFEGEMLCEVEFYCFFEVNRRGYDEFDNYEETDQSDIFYDKKPYDNYQIEEIDEYIALNEEDLKNELNDKYLQEI